MVKFIHGIFIIFDAIFNEIVSLIYFLEYSLLAYRNMTFFVCLPCTLQFSQICLLALRVYMCVYSFVFSMYSIMLFTNKVVLCTSYCPVWIPFLV